MTGSDGFVRAARALVAVTVAVAAVVALCALGPAPASAGGASLYEIGTPDLGLAAAGYAARAQDPGTVFTNPAGMTRLDGSQLQVGLQALYGDVAFTPNSNTTVSGPDGGNPVGFFPGGSAFFVHRASPRFAYGVGTFGNFGLGLDYEDDWAGRYYVQDATMLGISFMPAVAYRVSERFSLGAGVNVMYGIFDFKGAVNNLGAIAPDGSLALEDKDVGFGGQLGALYEISERTRLGATYTSPLKLDFEDTPEFSGLSPGFQAVLDGAGITSTPITLGITVPQGVMGSFFHSFGGKLALLGNVGWQQWSRFGKVQITADSTTLVQDRKYKDTWHGALGAQIQSSSAWRWSVGFAYDSNVVEDADRTPDLPLGPATRIAFGVQHPVSEKFEIGAGYTGALAGTLPLDQERGPLTGRLAGAYESAALHFFGVNGRWKL
ncbi:MAG: OmpP1/FadL family transporter [Candidatus Eiseniibacteriota bacterium]